MFGNAIIFLLTAHTMLATTPTPSVNLINGDDDDVVNKAPTPKTKTLEAWEGNIQRPTDIDRTSSPSDLPSRASPPIQVVSRAI
ncbi:hypothetical protein PoB_001296900 [Plakobranchus ocellatus]|uniref:Secreted protein n=1 Tax=Plakobranchus ocellatus TaxID=259542 RepID=A0AAV3YWM2_9GAST|nr:hypothetical protein PoB_001296900 [Plakobranchus ocellatus]